jgi:hypothetical protein
MGIVGPYVNKCRYDTQEQKFRYGIPAYTGPFRTLAVCEYNMVNSMLYCYKSLRTVS